MDFITDLPVSQGFNSLFVVVVCLSKPTVIAPCNITITAEEMAKLDMNHIWKQTGLPQAYYYLLLLAS